MIYKLFGGWFKSVIATLLPMLALVAMQSAHGATIPLTVVYPDIATKFTDITYVYDSGIGGTMKINGYTGPGSSKVTQTISFDGVTSLDVRTDQTALALGSASRYTTYELTAKFDTNGAFVSTGSSLTITGFVDGNKNTVGWQQYGTLANSGTLLAAGLTNFGFYGHALNANYDYLEIDFLLAATGGDLFNAGYGPGEGLRWGGNVTNASGLAPVAGIWDNAATSPFKQSFSCTAGNCTSQLDTYVPVPAAVWLFGSGLLGLFGVATRRRATRAG